VIFLDSITSSYDVGLQLLLRIVVHKLCWLKVMSHPGAFAPTYDIFK
jgi:hypothetical protein